MDMYKLKFTRLQNMIFRLLCIKAGSSLSQREIARLLNVSPTAVGKSVKLLEKEKFVIIRSSPMNIRLVELDRSSQKTIEMKRIENLKMIYESGTSGFLENSFPGCTIILFGSYSRGDDTIESDIDIAVISGKEKKIKLDSFEKNLERKIMVNFYPSIKEIHKNLRENILNGIVLSGGIEL